MYFSLVEDIAKRKITGRLGIFDIPEIIRQAVHNVIMHADPSAEVYNVVLT